MNKRFFIRFLSVVVLIVSVVGLVSYFHNYAHDFFVYGLSDWPTHEPASENCPWKREVFPSAGITAFIGSCTDQKAFDPSNGYAMVFSDSDKKVIGKWVTNQDYQFTIQVFTKQSSQLPMDVVKEWYAKLTPKQPSQCEIQNADQPVEHFSSGEINWSENPHPIAHKTRYKIDIKPEIIQQIMQNPGPNDANYDYTCGHLVGTTFASHAPYFEFDDRTPDKYLMVGSYGQEGPMIDLNSIRF
jgi:hypothetical protein